MSRPATSLDRWTTHVWRILCLTTAISALLLITNLWWTLHPIIHVTGITAAGVVTLLLVVAGLHDLKRSLRGSTRE